MWMGQGELETRVESGCIQPVVLFYIDRNAFITDFEERGFGNAVTQGASYAEQRLAQVGTRDPFRALWPEEFGDCFTRMGPLGFDRQKGQQGAFFLCSKSSGDDLIVQPHLEGAKQVD